MSQFFRKMIKEYLSICGEFENTIVIEKSKFICYIKGVLDEEDAKSFVLKIKKQNSLATHNCYAYIADEGGNVQKFSDDGEPQGTAGLPMLETLKNLGLSKVVAVVTRYFGGVKLGTGGLVRAYSNAVKDCAIKSKIENFVLSTIYKINLSYEEYSKFLGILTDDYLKTISSDFLNEIEIFVACKNDYTLNFENKIKDIYCGKKKIIKIDEKFVSFKVNNG